MRVKKGDVIVESLTKNRQDRQIMEQMVAKFFAPSVISDAWELTEGVFQRGIQNLP